VSPTGTVLRRLLVGLALVTAFWWLSWHRVGGPTARGWLFFGLWLGYILVVDGLCLWRTGTSPSSRGWRAWLVLFIVSAPAWWLFEFFNRYLGNWEYLGVATYGRLDHAFFSTLSFTTVVPAVFTTAELLASFGLPATLTRWPAVPATAPRLTAWIALGWLLLGGVIAAPQWFFPATWLAVFFILDPINHLSGRPAVAARVARGDWRLVALLGAAALVCGFFWELWNLYSWPKWIYHVPYVGFLKVFEMPLLGYLGYIPFGLELYALYHFLLGLINDRGWPLALDRLA